MENLRMSTESWMITKNNYCSFCLILLVNWLPNSLFTQEVLSIADNRQLFLDHYVIESMDDLSLQLHHPVNEGPVLYFDEPWEGDFSFYSTILKDDGVFKAYYRGVREPKDGSDAETTCIAVSVDGIHWAKPKLSLFKVDGYKNNNVILAHAAPVTHNFSPFIDKNPNCAPEQKYKAFGGGGKGLIAYVSKDGYNWKRLRQTPVITQGRFDSQNVAFWSESEKQYICYFRTSRDGFRSVSRSTSPDFINWTSPIEMEFGDTPLEHLYTQQTSPYYRAPQIYIATGARFMPGRKVLTQKQAEAHNVNPKYFNDISDAIIMTSRGGSSYNRTFMESYLRPGIGLENWVSRTNYPALNVVETSNTEMSIYVNEDYAQPTAHLKRYSMRIDGFASLHAGYTSGEMTTKPFEFSGQELEINYSTSAVGSVQIEIQDENGTPIPGFEMVDCQEIIGNEIKRIVAWQGEVNVAGLQNQVIKLRIKMKDADLYSFKFNQ